MPGMSWPGFLLACLVATSAGAIDLNGTWEGKVVCRDFDGAKSRSVAKDQTLLIGEPGGILHVVWVDVATFDANLIDDARKPENRGDLMAVDCRTDADPSSGADEIARFKVKVDRAKGRGRLRGSSFLAVGGGSLSSCKWSFKLVDTAEPAIGGCP